MGKVMNNSFPVDPPLGGSPELEKYDGKGYRLCTIFHQNGKGQKWPENYSHQSCVSLRVSGSLRWEKELQIRRLMTGCRTQT